MRKIVTMIAMCLTLVATAQKVRFDVKISSKDTDITKIFIQPAEINAVSRNVVMRNNDGVFKATVPASSIGFYNLTVVRNQSQLNVPIYVKDARSVSLNANYDGRVFVIDNTPDNYALTSLDATLNGLDRELWRKDGMTAEQIKSLMDGYESALDSLLAVGNLSAPVVEYMKTMAYVRAFYAYSSIPRAQQISESAIPFSRDEVLPRPADVIDNKYATLFNSTMQVVKNELPSLPSLLDRLSFLYEIFRNDELRLYVATSIMRDFVSNYNYSKDFDGGLAIVKKATEKYGFSSFFVNEFVKYKSTLVGSPFPKDLKFVNAKGKTVSIDDFKGKYVYIDMWASWCGPCCKEVPHLQKLESELQNDDVVFVSISSDSDEAAWKNKMKELNMHGNQLIDKENSLGSALNVGGIPFFVIYDKEGNLHTYGALRPSTGDRLKNILENLN